MEQLWLVFLWALQLDLMKAANWARWKALVSEKVSWVRWKAVQWDLPTVLVWDFLKALVKVSLTVLQKIEAE